MSTTVILHVSPGYSGLVRAPKNMLLNINSIVLALLRAPYAVSVFCRFGDDDEGSVPMMFKAWPLNPEEVYTVAPKPESRALPLVRSVEFDAKPIDPEALVEEASLAVGHSPVIIVRVQLDIHIITNPAGGVPTRDPGPTGPDPRRFRP